MGTSSLQADSLVLQPRRKRSFSLPSFGRSSGGERAQELGSSAAAEEAVRVQKAAAWQWYTRGVGEAVLPTKRPPVGHLPPSQPPTHDSTSSKGGESMTGYNSSVLQKKPESPRAASRFKAEARPASSATPLALSDAPLYDEFELSRLRTHMADFVQRLQHQQFKDIAVADLQKSKPRPNSTAAASVATAHQRNKAPPPVAAATASDQAKLTKLPSSVAPVASTRFHMRPFSALHRLFRKVVSGSVLKSTKNSLNSSPAVYEPEVLPEEGDDNTQYHHHHYIHHHHHHYHYDQSPEESIATIPRQRRCSESSGISPRIPSLWTSPWEAESDEEEKGVEESPIHAYLSRRRTRHSDSFTPKKAAFDEEEGVKGESEKAELSMQFPRRYESERSPNKIPSMDYAQPAPAGGKDEFDEELADMKSRRRRSAENYREEASLERKAEGGGKSGGGMYKLGGGATQPKPLVRRRHSETSQRPEAVQMGRPYWQSPSGRYVPAAANANPARPPRNAVLPPLYPR